MSERRHRAVAYVTGGRGRRPPRRMLVLGLLALGGLGGIAAVLLTQPHPASRFDGFVYVESNSARHGANTVVAYRFARNRLRLLGTFPTHGTGVVDRGVTGSLDAQGQLAFDARRRVLYAVNQGSDTIAAFRVARDGTLAAVAGSPFPARGASPASLAVSGDLLVAVDKAHDPARILDTVPPREVSFRIAGDGSLAPTGHSYAAPFAASPTQALVVRGSLVVTSEEGGPFRVLTLAADGKLARAPGSPLDPEASIFRPRYRGARWAIGLVAHPTRGLVYADQSATAQLLVYALEPDGRLRFVRAVHNDGARLPCWTTISADGRFLYTANAGNGTVSTFDLAQPERPRHLQTVDLRRGANPWGLALDPAGRTLFVVDPRAVAGVPSIVGNRLHVLAVGRDGRVDEIVDARQNLPLPPDSSPLGIAVVARS